MMASCNIPNNTNVAVTLDGYVESVTQPAQAWHYPRN